MISRFFSKKGFWLVILCLPVASSVQAELANVGPMDRLYEYLFFDGHIESGSNSLDIFSGLNDTNQNISYGNDNGIWKANTSVGNDWKTASTAAWQDAVIVYNPGKPEDILPDRFPKDLAKNESTQAQFIWAPDSDGSNDGLNGPAKAYFSYTFNLGTDFFNTQNKLTASANVLADDFFVMSVNGHFVGNGLLDTQIANNSAQNGLGTPVELDFAKWLQPEKNTISIFAYDGYKVEQSYVINDLTVSVPDPNGAATINATFDPKLNQIDVLKGISIDQTANILGYDHFNWLQVMYVNDGSFPSSSCLHYNYLYCIDPVNGYLWNSGLAADNKVFYWDELPGNNTYIDHITSEDILNFYDTPSINLNDLTFYTFLVGIFPNRTFDPLYQFKWEAKSSDEYPPTTTISLISSGRFTPTTEDPELISAIGCLKGAGAINIPDNIVGKTCFYVDEPPIKLLLLSGLGLFAFNRRRAICSLNN